MPLHLGDHTAVLTGSVTVDEAEPLAAWLRSVPGGTVDLGACDHLHTAALQAILAAGVKVAAPPADHFMRTWVLPLLAAVPAPATTPTPEEVRS